MSARIALAVTLALAASAAACNPYLTAMSPAPPGRSARLEPVDGFWTVKSYRLELSQGAAIAIACSYVGSCEHMTVASDDSSIVEIRTASLSALHPNYMNGSQQPEAIAVVVGHTAGTTHLHVHAKQGDRDVAVTILPQP